MVIYINGGLQSGAKVQKKYGLRCMFWENSTEKVKISAKFHFYRLIFLFVCDKISLSVSLYYFV